MGIRTAFGRMIEARERHARAYVNAALSQMDDETLRRAGLRREDVAKARGGAFPY